MYALRMQTRFITTYFTELRGEGDRYIRVLLFGLPYHTQDVTVTKTHLLCVNECQMSMIQLFSQK